eukprot:XP_011665236.1 PREDICTED: uncharacterized protein LOC105438741 [Strongylocentrotus purpuratus]
MSADSMSCSSSDTDCEPPVVLVLGHSYISRLNQYIARDPKRDNLSLEKSSVLSFMYDVGHDQPGSVFSASSQLDLVWNLSPDAVVLDLGSNDLCDGRATTESTMLSIVDLALRIARIPGVRHVLVCSIIPRLFVPNWKPNFNANVQDTNRLLAKFLEGLPNVHFWRHRSFALNHTRLFSSDGFHFNDAGMLRYYRSVRGAVMKAYKMD